MLHKSVIGKEVRLKQFIDYKIHIQYLNASCKGKNQISIHIKERSHIRYTI